MESCFSICCSKTAPPPRSTLFPYTTLFRSILGHVLAEARDRVLVALVVVRADVDVPARTGEHRSEEHTSELQSLTNLVCRLLLEKKKSHGRPGAGPVRQQCGGGTRGPGRRR